MSIGRAQTSSSYSQFLESELLIVDRAHRQEFTSEFGQCGSPRTHTLGGHLSHLCREIQSTELSVSFQCGQAKSSFLDPAGDKEAMTRCEAEEQSTRRSKERASSRATTADEIRSKVMGSPALPSWIPQIDLRRASRAKPCRLPRPVYRS